MVRVMLVLVCGGYCGDHVSGLQRAPAWLATSQQFIGTQGTGSEMYDTGLRCLKLVQRASP